MDGSVITKDGPYAAVRPCRAWTIRLLIYVYVKINSAPRRRVGVDAEHQHYKWWALSCTSLGMLLATINSGTLIIALPDLERALGTRACSRSSG